MTLTIDPAGNLRCLYTELLPLGNIGIVSIRRASHVEPTDQGEWTAEIIDGPTLGPFPTRSAALLAEVDYLETNTL